MAKAIETLSIQLVFKEGSGSQQIIDKIGNSIKKLQVTAGQTGPSIDHLRRSVNNFAKQGNRSISTIEGQVTALRALRREADINSKEFKELTADIAKYEKQLNKAQGRRGGGARQATQIAGAVISGGIFGGPEGAIGGALGSFGGVQSAFAGAAIGAQVGGIRKAIGSAADYAAQIGKLKIALEGVTDTSDEYTSALAAAARVSAELNVPQEQSIRGITRLAAAVKGANGPMRDAETTFRNVTAAIKATGGGSDDVKGAITAMVQVFSKGKVSAEELSGQLGERLPGAVTMFAKANEMTLPELQKNLKAGTVGLNELMNFIVELGVKFDGTAKKIASSNEEAGARLTLAFDDMKARVGGALISTGAGLQNTFTKFIKEITPVLVQVLPVIAKAFLAVAKNIDKIVVAAAAALAIIAVGKIAAIVASIGGLSAAIFTLKLNAIVAAKALVGLNTAALLNPYTALAAGAAALALNIYNAAQEQRALNLLLREGTVAEIDKKISENRSLTAAAETRRLQGGEGGIGSIGYEIKGSDAGMVGFSRKRDTKDITRLRGELPQLVEARRVAVETRDQGADLDPRLFKRFDYGLVTDKDKGTGGTGTTTDKTQGRIDRANDIVRKLQDQLGIQKQQSDIGKLIAKQAKERSDLEARFVSLQKEGQIDAVTQANIKAQGLLDEKQALALSERTNEIIAKATKPIEDITKGIQEKVRLDKEYARLIAEGVNPELAKQLMEIEKQFKVSKELLDIKIAELQASVNTANAEERTTKAFEDRVKALEDLKAAREGLPGKKDKAVGAAKEGSREPTFAEQIGKDAADAELALKKLVNPANQVKLAAGAIGDAFSDSFMKVVTGKASAQEALSSFFQTVANHFLDMAKQIIAKQLVMITYQTILKALGAVAGASGGGGGGVEAASKHGTLTTGPLPDLGTGPGFADPKIFLPGGKMGRASGGPVEGGRPYLVGERGPELFVPGQSGGVMRNEDMRSLMGRSPASAGAASMNFSFETTSIGGTEYVSREQLEQAMAATRKQASNDGAKRGMSMTLDKMQNSPRTRTRIGLR